MNLEDDISRIISVILAHGWPRKVRHITAKMPVDANYRHLEAPLKYYRLYTCTNGSCKARIPTISGSKSIDLHAGDSLIVYPGSWIYSIPSSKGKPFNIFGILLTPDNLRFLENNNLNWPNPHFSFDFPINEHCSTIEQAFKLFDDSILLENEDISQSIIKLIYKLTRELLETKIDISQLGKKQLTRYHLQQLIYYLNHNFNRPLTRKELAKQHHLPDSTVAQFFKTEFTTTYRKHVTNLKMQYATELLTATRMKIQDISEALGYKQDDSFSFAFEKYFAMTPTTFRRSVSQNQNKMGEIINKDNILEMLSLSDLQENISLPDEKSSVTLHFTNLSQRKIELYEVGADHRHILCAKVDSNHSVYLTLSNTVLIIVKKEDGTVLGGYNPLKHGSIAIFRG